MSATTTATAPAPAERAAPASRLHTVQVGQEWVSEKPGGLNRYYSELVHRLPSVGVSVTGLVTGSSHVSARSSGAVRPFAALDASLPARLAGVRAGVREALHEVPDSLPVAHFALYSAPWLDLVRNRPFVVHFQGPWAEESRVEGQHAVAVAAKRWIEARVYRRAARLIVLSRAFGDLLASTYAVDPSRIRVIPGGVDAQRFEPTVTREHARELLEWPAGRPIALVVRRLVKRMGLEDLVDAVREARREVPELLVLVAGSGPLETMLRERAADLADHIRFLGFVPEHELAIAYRGADLSIVPSVALEGFGLIVAESLAAGTPVLVTPVGGLPETLEGLAPQCVLTGSGPGPLASALVDALRGRLRLPSAEACMRHARTRFDWSVVTEQVRGAYEEALA